jgi:hypothetical protein
MFTTILGDLRAILARLSPEPVLLLLVPNGGYCGLGKCADWRT